MLLFALFFGHWDTEEMAGAEAACRIRKLILPGYTR